jgi:hypothetical protein
MNVTKYISISLKCIWHKQVYRRIVELCCWGLSCLDLFLENLVILICMQQIDVSKDIYSLSIGLEEN